MAIADLANGMNLAKKWQDLKDRSFKRDKIPQRAQTSDRSGRIKRVHRALQATTGPSNEGLNKPALGSDARWTVGRSLRADTSRAPMDPKRRSARRHYGRLCRQSPRSIAALSRSLAAILLCMPPFPCREGLVQTVPKHGFQRMPAAPEVVGTCLAAAGEGYGIASRHGLPARRAAALTTVEIRNLSSLWHRSGWRT
jgi:hypothetical protein